MQLRAFTLALSFGSCDDATCRGRVGGYFTASHSCSSKQREGPQRSPFSSAWHPSWGGLTCARSPPRPPSSAKSLRGTVRPTAAGRPRRHTAALRGALSSSLSAALKTGPRRRVVKKEKELYSPGPARWRASLRPPAPELRDPAHLGAATGVARRGPATSRSERKKGGLAAGPRG